MTLEDALDMGVEQLTVDPETPRITKRKIVYKLFFAIFIEIIILDFKSLSLVVNTRKGPLRLNLSKFICESYV